MNDHLPAISGWSPLPSRLTTAITATANTLEHYMMWESLNSRFKNRA
jgi:hypothetical protein